MAAAGLLGPDLVFLSQVPAAVSAQQPVKHVKNA